MEKRTNKSSIPVSDIINSLDALFAKNDMKAAGALLEHWEKEALLIGDSRGEITIHNELIGYYRKAAKEEKCLHSVGRALALIQSEGIEDTVSGATVKLNAATAIKAFGKAEEAIPIYREALAVFRKELDKKDPLLAGLCNNMALALVDVGSFGEAEKLYNEALSILSGSREGCLDCAVTYVNMAHMYDVCGEKSKISGCMGNALLLLCDPSLEQNGYMAFVYSKCAPSFAFFGDEDTCAYLSDISEEIYKRNRENEGGEKHEGN